jgi:hypothetical protein
LVLLIGIFFFLLPRPVLAADCSPNNEEHMDRAATFAKEYRHYRDQGFTDLATTVLQNIRHQVDLAIADGILSCKTPSPLKARFYISLYYLEDGDNNSRQPDRWAEDARELKDAAENASATASSPTDGVNVFRDDESGFLVLALTNNAARYFALEWDAEWIAQRKKRPELVRSLTNPRQNAAWWFAQKPEEQRAFVEGLLTGYRHGWVTGEYATRRVISEMAPGVPTYGDIIEPIQKQWFPDLTLPIDHYVGCISWWYTTFSKNDDDEVYFVLGELIEKKSLYDYVDLAPGQLSRAISRTIPLTVPPHCPK